MSTSWVVTGATQGLGFAFLQALSGDSNNTVVGLVRNKAAADKKVKEAGLANVSIVEADYSDFGSLKRAAKQVAGITGGKLEYLIHNAAYISLETAHTTLADYDDKFEVLERDLVESFASNVVATIKVAQAFVPLLKKGSAKKVAAISSGMADLDFINQSGLSSSAPYSISKAALNAAVAKLNATYKQDDKILFLSISPGLVVTEKFVETLLNPKEEDKARALESSAKAAAFAPNVTPAQPIDAANVVLKVIHQASIEGGHGGVFCSHFGPDSKKWL